MNANQSPSDPGPTALTGSAVRLSRRRFLVRSAALLGAMGLTAEVLAAAGSQSDLIGADPAPPSAPAGGPRERPLHAADFYRPHALAG